MDRWSQFSLKDKSDLMSLYIQNGISSLEEIKKHYNSFATGGSLPDHDPDNPYHYHNAKGEKIVITPEDWEANVGKPYFKEIEDAVRAEQAAHPAPEYEINPNFVRDLRSTYSYNMGNSYQNYRNFSSSLPQGYTFTSEGMVVDPQGNYYVQSGYRQSPRFTYSTDNPLRFTINKGKPIERNLTFYPVNMDKKVKAPLPVDRTLDVKAEYQAAVDNYIQNNINNRYGIGWYDHTSDSFKDEATYGTLGIFSFKNPDEYGWESGTEHYYPMSEGQRNKLNDALNRVVDRHDKLGTYSKEDMLSILKAGGLEQLIDDFIATSTKPSRKEAEKKAVISISPLEKVNTFATGGHLCQDGGHDDDKTFVSSQASETGWMPEINIVANKPSWQQGLTYDDWSRARRYYSNPDGTLTSQGFEFLKNVASKRRTGQSNFMRDVNKLSYIPNAAVGAIGAIPATAGLIASAPVLAEAAAPYVVPTIKSMFGIKNLAGLGLSMGLATGVDQTISDNSDYKSLPDWANQTFFDGSPETEQALEFFRPEYMFAPYASKVVNKGVRLVNNTANTVKSLYNSKVSPVLADALYKDASFDKDPIMQMLYNNYISGESTPGNLLPQKTIQTGLDDDAIQLLRNRTLNRNIQAIKEDPNLSSSFLGESRIKKLNEIFDKDLSSIKVGKYSGQDYKNAGHGDWGGFYNEQNKFISINRDSGYPMHKTQAHEGLHYIDSKYSLTTEQDATLSKAFDDDFNTLPETEYAPEHLKSYKQMRKERITTNRDARDELLGYEDIPLEKQNQMIDQATDDAIFSAVENANGYGQVYIKRLRAENKLTHEKANAFRESMKKVGAITGIIGTGAPLLNNNKN